MTFTLRRPAARVVLLDREARIFLIEAEDPIDPRKPDWLEIPGGGMGWNEDSGAAALRELHEETGIPNVDMGPCVWVQQTEYDFAGYHFESDDRIHVAWCDGGEYDPKGLEALEAAAFMGARWWTLDELMASDMPTVPYLLREHLPALIAGDLPAEPIDITPPPEHGGRRLSSCPSRGSVGLALRGPQAVPGQVRHVLDDLVKAQAAPAERPVSSTRLGETDDAEGEGEASGRFDAVDVDQFGDGVGHRSLKPADLDGEFIVGTDAFAVEQTELLRAFVDEREDGPHAAPDHVVGAGGGADGVGDVAAETPSHVADEFVEELPLRGEVVV